MNDKTLMTVEWEELGSIVQVQAPVRINRNFPKKKKKEGFRLRPDSKTKWVRIFGHEFSFLTEPSPNQVFHLCPMSSSANVAAPVLPGGCCWSQFWPGLFPHLPVTAGARAGQAGTQTTQICSAHSSSYPCLAPPVLSCHIQS